MKNKIKTLAATAALALSLSGTAVAAVDQFLKFEGVANGINLGGDSDSKDHVGEIDVLAWSWGASQSGTTHMGAGGGVGKANFQDLSITKYIDSSSSGMITHIATGTHIGKATLSVNKADGGIEITKLLMEDVIVTSVSTGGSGGEDRLTENITLNFSKFTITNIEENADGSAGTKVEYCWDIAGNKDC